MAKLWSKVNIHYTTYFLILISLLSGLFKYTLTILFIIIIHELGHIFFILIFKRRISSINIYPFGGLVKIDSFLSSDILEDILIASGGILSQVLLGYILYGLFKLNIIEYYIYKLITTYNILIITFNLIPITPLDGSKIVKYIFELIVPYKKTFYIILVVSTLSLLAILIYNITIIKDNTITFLFLFYMNILEFKNIKYIMNRFYLERYNYNFLFKHKVHIKKKENMYKNRINIINNLNEKEYLKKYLFKDNKGLYKNKVYHY